MYWRSPDVSPLHQYSWRDRLQNQVRPVSRLRRSASSFIQAIISTSPVPCSCTIAGTRPLASYLIEANSSSVWEIGVDSSVGAGGDDSGASISAPRVLAVPEVARGDCHRGTGTCPSMSQRSARIRPWQKRLRPADPPRSDRASQ